jgi:hypothetical protein
MMPSLEFRMGIFFSKKEFFLLSVLELKNNLKNLKIDFKLTLFVPTGNWVKFLKMAGC